MCAEGRHRPPAKRSFLRNALQPGMPFTRRVLDIGANLGRRLRGGQVNDCCGRYGEPGC